MSFGMLVFIDLILLTSPFCFEQSILRRPASISIFFSGWFASTGVWNYSFVSISDISAQFEEHVWIITTERSDDLVNSHHCQRWRRQSNSTRQPSSLAWTSLLSAGEAIRWLEGTKLWWEIRKETVIKKTLLWCGFVNRAF